MPLRDGDPSRVGRFRLTARLGAGGMGVVYLGEARDGSQVAVKVLRPEVADDQEFRVRFRREAALLTRVQGLCTVQVIEADTDSATPFLATEYVDGPSLAEYVSTHGPLGHDLLYGLATGLAEALTAIHAAGVIHRDLKPGNVLLTRSGPKVIDFGIAQALDSTAITKTGVTVGSLGFMAPEQFDRKAGQAADVFAWGLTVGYAATGEHLFGTGPANVLVYRILHDSPDLAALPTSLRPVVAAALAKDPGDRPAATAILGQLIAPSGSDDTSTTTNTVLARNWVLPASAVPQAVPEVVSPRGRHLLVLAAAVLVAVAGGTGAALLTAGGATHTAAGSTGTTGATSTSTGAGIVVASKSASAPAQSLAPTQSLPAISQPGASPFRSSTIEDQPSAFDYVAGFGYGSHGLDNPSWDMSAPLNAVVAYYDGGVASGPGKVFFFANGRYVGSDTTDGSISVGAVRVSSTEIKVQYLLYKPGDSNCCPSGGTDNVRFVWTNGRLVRLDPIPSASQRFSQRS
jgi:serine/threonine protein kinase